LCRWSCAGGFSSRGKLFFSLFPRCLGEERGVKGYHTVGLPELRPARQRLGPQTTSNALVGITGDAKWVLDMRFTDLRCCRKRLADQQARQQGCQKAGTSATAGCASGWGGPPCQGLWRIRRGPLRPPLADLRLDERPTRATRGNTAVSQPTFRLRGGHDTGGDHDVVGVRVTRRECGRTCRAPSSGTGSWFPWC
jgi:hypothetical protein